MTRLGRAIDLINGDTEQLFPPVKDLDRQYIPAAVTIGQGTQVITVQAVIFQDHSVKGGNAQHPAGPVALYGFKDCVHLGHGHEQRGIALVKTDGHTQAKGHDVEKGIYRDIYVLPFLEIVPCHIFGHIVDIGSHAHVIAGNSLGKTSGTSGIKDIRKICFGIKFYM
jgi:hypothetical protein